MTEFFKGIKNKFQKEDLEIVERINKIKADATNGYHIEYCSICKQEYLRIPKSKLKNDSYEDFLAVAFLKHFAGGCC